jgi:hypothetical protein
VIEHDGDTDNARRPYSQIEAHLVAARLLEIGCDPRAWTATVVRVGDDDDDEFEVELTWNDPEPRKPSKAASEKQSGKARTASSTAKDGAS